MNKGNTGVSLDSRNQRDPDDLTWVCPAKDTAITHWRVSQAYDQLVIQFCEIIRMRTWDY